MTVVPQSPYPCETDGPRDLAVRLVVLGFDGPRLPAEVASLLAKGLAGVALFRRNLEDADQVRALCGDIRVAAGGAMPIVSVDQEGGRVQRLRGLLPDVPPMAEVGAAGPEAARAWGRRIGLGLADLGFNVDFAPVLDVDTNPANPIIGDRAFSGDPERVAVCGVAFLEGLESAGVLGCGKHYPGHGDASVDSHLDLPVLDVPSDLLISRERVPFAAAIRAGLAMMMTAHCLYPAVDPDRVATLSPVFLGDRLRRDLGFAGCIVTDDLGMQGIARHHTPERIAALGLAAGVDLFLHCGASGEGAAMVEALATVIAGDPGLGDAARRSCERVQALRARLA